MENLYFKDFINLSDEEINSAKIVLNMKVNDKNPMQSWIEENDVSYSYWSHYGKQRNYTKIGQLTFGFVQLPDDTKKWLLVTVGRITNIPKNPNVCDYDEISKYDALLGRMIMQLDKGNTYARYNFNLKKYINKIIIQEILPEKYELIKFNGYENVHVSYRNLKIILKGEKYCAYKTILSAVKGIYCLTDTKEGKLYIGSAYGDNGIAQRWENYIDSKTGGNLSLINLYKEKGEQYFEDNFEFTLIEFFGKNVSTDKIIERENYWKIAFATRGENGYNNN